MNSDQSAQIKKIMNLLQSNKDLSRRINLKKEEIKGQRSSYETSYEDYQTEKVEKELELFIREN